MNILLFLLGGLASFLIGSFPFSYWLVKVMRGIDIRTVGSGNAGATNVFRTQGKGLGSLALTLDALKGVVAVLVFPLIFHPETVLSLFKAQLLYGILAIIGHVWTPFLNWKGGKGVATSAGVFLALMPGPFGIGLGVFLSVFLTFRIISISSLSAACIIPVAVYFAYRSHPDFAFAFSVSLALAVFIFYTHRTNIARLLKGEEKRLINKKN
jgi:glycerol-3-phosphate acyltransferase PlsY